MYKQIGASHGSVNRIGPLHDPVTRYKITHAGEQLAQWDFQNNASRTSPLGTAFVLEVLLRNLLTSICDFVPCDRIVERAYSINTAMRRSYLLVHNSINHLSLSVLFVLLVLSVVTWSESHTHNYNVCTRPPLHSQSKG